MDDPSTIVETLDPDQIEAELDRLHRQQVALRALLRVARARHRGQLAPDRADAETARDADAR
jgi:hypothetical protein